MLGDLGVGHAGRHQGDDLALPVGQRVEQAGRRSRAGVMQREEAGDQPPGGSGREQGVAAGDRVILNPQVDLTDGRKVTIRPDSPKPEQRKS